MSTCSAQGHCQPWAGWLQQYRNWSAHILSGLPPAWSLYHRLGEVLKGILSKPSSPTSHPLKQTREKLSLKGNHTSLWVGHTLEWVGSRGKKVMWKKIKHGREGMNEISKISTGLILSYFGDLGCMCNITNVQLSNQYSLPLPLFSNFRN